MTVVVEVEVPKDKAIEAATTCMENLVRELDASPDCWLDPEYESAKIIGQEA
jgi:hypothetical protein